MSPELDTYAITKKVKEVLTDNNLGKTFFLFVFCSYAQLWCCTFLCSLTGFYFLSPNQVSVCLGRLSWV